jgi:hypothetical protein
MSANTGAISWTATMGLIPGYGHDNSPSRIAERKALLASAWSDAMEATLADTGFSVSTVMTDAIVLYPKAGMCPEGGEVAVTLSGSSNPRYVGPDEFEAFMDAVERTVREVQISMKQTSVRIEFGSILRSLYCRTDD